MPNFSQFALANGLQVYVHEDPTTPMAAVNVMYNVGSKDEDEQRTGFAHLFEHLMFGGSKHIPSYDTPLQLVGGTNNAFTSADVTNYYISLPAVNLETAFWLESDRMLSLSFDPEVLEVQRKVVIEEFKQRYLNQPYGDIWLKLRPLAYTNHPYRWATIGKDIAHIEEATLADVKDFFEKHYIPSNAVLVVGGNVTTEQVKQLAEKWFGPIPSGERPRRQLNPEPPQTAARELYTHGKVPANAIYKVYHMAGRFEAGYHETDLLCDILGRGKSARLYTALVQEKKLFSQISAYTLGSLEPGLAVISGHLTEGVRMQEANQAVEEILKGVSTNPVSEIELEMARNQALTTLAFGDVDLLNRTMNIAFAANAGDANLVNHDTRIIKKITTADLLDVSQKVFNPSNCSTLYYQKEL